MIAFEAHNGQEITWLDCVDYALSTWAWPGMFAPANDACINHEPASKKQSLCDEKK